MSLLETILDVPFIKRTRRNHALEHATIHVLSGRQRGLAIAGRSTASGFYLYGQVATEDVARAVNEALGRLRAGESQLAIHPNCGTNLVTSVMMSGLAAFTVMGVNRRDRSALERLPTLLLTTAAALIAAQPIGAAAQEHITTLADLGNLRVTGIRPVSRGRMTIHRVDTVST
jgi:hypothetical protein